MGSQPWEYRGLLVSIQEFLEAVVREGRRRLETSQPVFVTPDDAHSLNEFSTVLEGKPGMRRKVVSLHTSHAEKLRALSYPSENVGGYHQIDCDNNGIWQWSPVERVRIR
jgi:hypothetical protein